ncbi:MAG: hypothetical protein HQ525_03775 [Anaerolineae bacterium]|nr:hypothetical protein [Anaerolineae bacterium]
MRFLATNTNHVEVSDSMIAGNLIRRDGQFGTIDEEASIARVSERVTQFGDRFEETRVSGKPHVNVVHECFTKI